MRRGIGRLKKRIEEVEAFDPQTVQKRYAPEITTLETSIEETLGAVFGSGTIEYNRYYGAHQLDAGGRAMLMIGGSGPEPISEVRDDIEKGKQSSLALLRQAIRFLEEEITDRENETAPSVPAQAKRPSRKVFVVHGHDEAALQSVARYLEKLGLEAIILREQPDQGLTIIEKFEGCAAEVGFAVVLLTPDDIGGSTMGPQQASRARQNVIFELGYFAGKLGRGRACLLRKGDVEIPSDLYGVIYTDLDIAEGWKMKLVRELKAAKLDFDANRAWE
ncbi:hypothetical protein CR165_21405 [Pseudoroseomonas aestuarii]|uniref:CD-NTase-associated protein 12/Pycsar effector protein TIR domain-containing protein n=2 Tax=Teichococcus aestuarii TaxID=568898 RepID=A0A2U1UYU7_9PROT|nr:hypothetical protein CR165_21405 [Pseudoroseomonas aestuarii]